MKLVIKKLYSSQFRILVGISMVTAAGLFGSYQNFDSIKEFESSREISSIPDMPKGSEIDIQEEIAPDTVVLSDEHKTLPSVSETVISVGTFRIKSHYAANLKVLPAIGLRPSEMKSIGIISGQKLEAEVNGAIIPVYAYALASNDDAAQGINISPTAAKDLGAKVGDKITLRQLQEAPPKILEKN